MKRTILSLFILLFLSATLIAQHNVGYYVSIPTSCDEGSADIVLTTGSGVEGGEFTIPSFTIPKEFQILGSYFRDMQLIADAFADARIGLPEGSLNEDVTFVINLNSAKCDGNFEKYGLLEALSLTIQVVGDSTHDPFSYYHFNEGKQAYIVLKVENMLPLLQKLGMGIDGIFGWFAQQGLTPDLTGISIERNPNEGEFVLYLSHFSKIVIGAYATPTDISTAGQLPSEYKLGQNYPNPFNPTTNISYSLPQSGFTRLTVYNSIGVEVRTLVAEVKTAGTYELTFDASELTSGIYFYDLTSNNFRSTKKMILIK